MFITYRTDKTMCKILLASAAMVVMTVTTSIPSFAVEERTSNQNEIPQYTEQEVKQGWENAKDAVSEAGQNVSEAAKETFEDIKAALNGGKEGIKDITIDRRTTAAGMIGQPVYNASNERVAMVKDIILNHHGDAVMVILADGEWTGLGKLTAFDYSVITQTNAQGDLIAPISEETIDHAASFSYDRNNNDSKSVKVIPENGYSVSELLDSQLLDTANNRIADIDNISFKNGHAENLVVSFGQTLGLGGSQAVIGYNDPSLIMHNGKPYFQLNEEKAKQFEIYKDATLSH